MEKTGGKVKGNTLPSQSRLGERCEQRRPRTRKSSDARPSQDGLGRAPI